MALFEKEWDAACGVYSRARTAAYRDGGPFFNKVAFWASLILLATKALKDEEAKEKVAN